MLDHHIQRAIVYHLAFADELRFSELKPDDIESKLFTYHLKKVIAEGYVVKTPDGMYQLTSEGRRVGKGALKKQSRLIDRAYSQVLLIIQREDGAWLLFKRGTHPLLGLTGFMQAQPSVSQDVITTAHEACLAKTGLDASFEVISNGYFRILQDDKLESFTHFTLLAAKSVKGELVQNDELGEYYWENTPDFGAEHMLPTANVLSELYLTREHTFTEHTFNL